MATIIFDHPRTWEHGLIAALGDLYQERLTALQQPHEYPEDSLDTLLASNRESIRRITLGWIAQNTVAAFHGTKVTTEELRNITTEGLLPLNPEVRVARLTRALSAHPEWASIAPGIANVIARANATNEFGTRTGQVHLTLSKSGLENFFNHYVTLGSEFDQKIAFKVLGQQGMELLCSDGTSHILQFSIPGDLAITAANRFRSIEDAIARGEVPNIAHELLTTLSARALRPDFDPAALMVDCGLIFHNSVPPEWMTTLPT